MQELTPQQERKLEKALKIAESGALAIAEHIFELEEKFDETVEEIKKTVPDLDRVLETVKGKDGENGKDGEDYIITDEDKAQIAQMVVIDEDSISQKTLSKIPLQEISDKISKGIKVPIVEKITEKTEIIKEIPIVTNNIEVKEVAVTDTAEIIVEKINDLPTDDETLKIDASHIRNLPKSQGGTFRGVGLTDGNKGDVVVSNNGKTFTVVGGASSVTTVVTVSGAINDSNVTFTASTEPDLLVINGGIYKQTGGAITWTYSAGTITLSSAVGTGGTIFGLSKSTLDKCVVSILINDDISLTTGDGKAYWRVPEEIDGWVLTEVYAARASGTGAPSFQVHNVTAALDMLSTNVTIDSGETDSTTAATPAVINTSNDDVSGADRIRFDCDVAGTTTLWSEVQLVFERP